jgi:[ribosomal protein S18]-alanine N-acetyltransferase
VPRATLQTTSSTATSHWASELWARIREWHRRLNYFPGQFNPYVARKRLRPVHIRPYVPADLDACLELYRLNEPGRFPPGILPEFETYLREGLALFLVIEEEGTIVGCGGIQFVRGPESEHAHLVFGLIHPERRQSGLGSVLLLARLTTLPDEEWIIGLDAVPSSRSFYERFGFVYFMTVSYDDDWEGTVLWVSLSRTDCKLSETFLAGAGVTLARDGLVVPVRQSDEPAQETAVTS